MENGQSRGPTPLLRQPASSVSRDFPYVVAKKPAARGLLALAGVSLCPEFDDSSGATPTMTDTGLLPPFANAADLYFN